MTDDDDTDPRSAEELAAARAALESQEPLLREIFAGAIDANGVLGDVLIGTEPKPEK